MGELRRVRPLMRALMQREGGCDFASSGRGIVPRRSVLLRQVPDDLVQGEERLAADVGAWVGAVVAPGQDVRLHRVVDLSRASKAQPRSEFLRAGDKTYHLILYHINEIA